MAERRNGERTVGPSHRIINLFRTGEGRTSKPQDPESLIEKMREIETWGRRARRLFNRG